MAVHIHPLEIPSKCYKPIGQIVAGWNLTEALISSIIWHIHGIKKPEQGRLFTYRPSAQEKLRIFKVSLKRFAKPGMKDELTGLLNRATDLKAKRNMIAHGLWGRMPKEPKTWKVFFHRDTDDMILLRRQVMTSEAVAKIAGQISVLNYDLKKWMARNRVPPP